MQEVRELLDYEGSRLRQGYNSCTERIFANMPDYLSLSENGNKNTEVGEDKEDWDYVSESTPDLLIEEWTLLALNRKLMMGLQIQQLKHMRPTLEGSTLSFTHNIEQRQNKVGMCKSSNLSTPTFSNSNICHATVQSEC